MTPCRECSAQVKRDELYRPREYCDRKCRSAAERRRSRVWKEAARSSLPNTATDLASLLGDVRRVRMEVAADRQIKPVPAAAATLLATYEQALEEHSRELARREQQRRESERWQAEAKVRRERQEAERAALDAYITAQVGA